jgi:hypothetical protein
MAAEGSAEKRKRRAGLFGEIETAFPVVRFAPTKIFVKDFGPIKEADIDLGRVTILMGPNNTGKTYTALLMPLLEQLVRGWSIASFLRDELFIEVLVDTLLRLYSVDGPEDLVRRGSDEAELRFVLKPEGDQIGDILELKIRIDKSGAVSYSYHVFGEPLETKKVLEISPLIYIPAERAGIMRIIRQLLRLHIETSWHMAPPRLKRKLTQLMMSERIRLPGVVGVLLDQILDTEKFTLEERKKAFVAPALELLEKEVLSGRLDMYEDLSVMYYEAGAEKPIDLINASSMVSEVSAIYLLSGKLRKGWWLIIEEPEAHVHPRGQMGLARFMAMLARLGVNVIATTHSDLIALKLAQMVGLAGLSPQDRRKLGYREDENLTEYLTKEELALYFMEPTEEGSVARKVEVSETGEVSELPTYSKVVEEMYGEAVKLLELHGKVPKISEG